MSEKKQKITLNAEEFGAALQIGVKKGTDTVKASAAKVGAKARSIVESVKEKTASDANSFENTVEEVSPELLDEIINPTEYEPSNAFDAFIKQFVAQFKKDCLAPEKDEVVGTKRALITVAGSVCALVVIVASVLLILTFGIKSHTGITVNEFIESYNSIPETVSGTDAVYCITTYIPEYEDIKIPEDATLKNGKGISLYDGHVEIAAELSGRNIVRLEIYGVDFPNFDPEQNTFVDLEDGDYSYLYYYIALGKALRCVLGEDTVYDVYAAASYAYTMQSYASYYSTYGLGNVYSSEYEVDGRTICAGYDLDKDCLFIEAIDEPILNWPARAED